MQPEPWKDARPEDPIGVWRYLLIDPMLQDEPQDDLLAQDHHHVFQHARLLIVAAFGMQINRDTTGGYFDKQLWRTRRIVVLRKASLSPGGRLNEQHTIGLRLARFSKNCCGVIRRQCAGCRNPIIP